jgi:hypothetical protein
VFSYSDQAAIPTWDDLVGTWDQLSTTWDAIGAAGLDSPTRLFFAVGSNLGRESYAAFQNFGVDFNGVWRSTPALRQSLSDNIIIHGYEVVYRSGGRVQFGTPDSDGNWQVRFAAILPQHRNRLYAELIESLSEGVAGGLEITLLPPGIGDVILQNLVIGDGETVTLVSTTDIPGDTVVEVLSGGTLIALDSPLVTTVPEISRVRLIYTLAGPKNSGGVIVL